MTRCQQLKLPSASILGVQICTRALGICALKLPSLKEEFEPFNFHHFLASSGWIKVTFKRPKGRSLKASVIVKVNRQRAHFKIDVRSSYDGSSLLTMPR
jgi:hypothetical protein